ncbi:hypothetical protein Syun_015285 [Stephania yunnanensis]|uniref:Ribosome-inactivating protein n=1 Tax=Stephania yunnanensis TaxID=152371 RepID=A0AAP0PCR5_9MAGN
MKMKWSAILAVWVCWTITIQSHQIWSATLSLPSTITDSKLGAPSYPKVTYDAKSVDEKAYGEMIKKLRNLLVSGSYSHGIPRLRDSTTVPDSERYILVEIAESRGQTVTFAIDVTNAYIVGYRVGNQRYFFNESQTNAPDLLFTDATVASPERRSSNYNALESRAGVRRQNITLSLQKLLGAISTLTSRPENPRSLLIVIQMISEAARYWEIESRVRNNGDFDPDSYMIDLENSWSDLSEQIQISDFLAFETEITIGDRVADNVNSFVIAGLYLMLFVCNNNPMASTTASSTNTSFDVSHLQLVTQQQQQPNLLGVGGADDQTCKHSVEPRTRIMGRNGMCVDVEKFSYSDNNPIIIFPCKSSDFKNQFWTLGKNGRIQSLEKCLATLGTTPGSSVVIHECETLDDTALRWAMFYTGELVNAHSGLALTAKDGTSASKLTLEENDSSSFQTWKATNKLTPVDVYIHGQKNQCIYYNGRYGVYTESCSKGSSKQQWRLYPDGTIRPIDWLDGCIEIASLSSAENAIYIQAGYCNGSPELHKWVFSHDGAIRNWKSQKVIDASATETTYLVAWDFHGGMNQIWTLEYV